MSDDQREKLYEGKAKIIYAATKAEWVIQFFKDDASAFNRKKLGTIEDKGIFNNCISSTLFRYLADNGVANHFVEQLSEREMLVRRLEMLPVELIVRNIVAGSLSRRLAIKAGTELSRPIVEFCYKSDELDDPLINDDHIEVLGFGTRGEIQQMRQIGLKVNELLRRFFEQRHITLVDFKLEFGKHDSQLMLGDEISPDSCRFWEADTHKSLDKDRFRHDLGGVEAAYREIYERVCQADRTAD